MGQPEVPADIILPEPKNQQEIDLFRALQDNSNQVNSALNAIGDDLDEKVKASSGDTAGYLDAKVDDTTIQVVANQLVSKDGGIDHDALLNTHDLTTNIDHDTITNNHNLTTDIDHDQLTNFTSTEHFTMLDEDDMSTDSATQAATQQSVKKYVDDQIAGIGVLSNVVFSWSATESYAAADTGFIAGTSVNPDIQTVTLTNSFLGNNTVSYATMLNFRLKKISSISTITIEARIWSSDAAVGREAVCQVDIGGKSNTVTRGAGSAGWATSSDIDLESATALSNGTTYDGVIQLKNNLAGIDAYISAITLIAS